MFQGHCSDFLITAPLWNQVQTTESHNTKATRRHGVFSVVPRHKVDHLCGLAVRVLGYRSGGPGSIPDTTKNK
jgi:hypothetical protein